MQLFSHGKNGKRHGSRARAPNDDDERRRRTTWRPSSLYQVLQSWITAYIFYIRHPYDV